MVKVEIVEGMPKRNDGMEVGPFGDYQVGSGRIYTRGIGPCLAIALYDPEKKQGALAHISGARNHITIPEALYPENIAFTLASHFEKSNYLEAVLAGESLRNDKISDIVKRDLAYLHIPINGEDLGDSGSHQGREVHLDCQTGLVTIYRLPPLQF